MSIGSAVSQVGAINMATAAPLLALALSNSPIFAGWVLAAGTIPAVLLHLPAGLIADRFDRHQIMRVSQLVRIVVASLLAVGLLFVHGEAKSALFITAVFVDGCAVAFYNLAETVAVRHVVPKDTLHIGVGRNEARQHLAVLAGRPLGGFLYAVGLVFPFVFAALTALFSFLWLRWMRSRDFKPYEEPASEEPAPTEPASEERRPPSPQAERDTRSTREGLRLLIRDRFLLSTFGACALANFCFQTLMLLLVTQAQQQDVSSSKIGLLLATSGLGGYLGSVLAIRSLHKRTPRRVVITRRAVWFLSILVVFIAASESAVLGMLAWGACGFLGAQINVALTTYEMSRVPVRQQGLVTGVNRFLTTGALSIGALCAGYIVAVLNPGQVAMLVAGGFAIVAFIPIVMGFERLLMNRFASSRERSVPAPQSESEPTAV